MRNYTNQVWLKQHYQSTSSIPEYIHDQCTPIALLEHAPAFYTTTSEKHSTKSPLLCPGGTSPNQPDFPNLGCTPSSSTTNYISTATRTRSKSNRSRTKQSTQDQGSKVELSNLEGIKILLFLEEDDAKYILECPEDLYKCSMNIRPPHDPGRGKHAMILVPCRRTRSDESLEKEMDPSNPNHPKTPVTETHSSGVKCAGIFQWIGVGELGPSESSVKVLAG